MVDRHNYGRTEHENLYTQMELNPKLWHQNYQNQTRNKGAGEDLSRHDLEAARYEGERKVRYDGGEMAATISQTIRISWVTKQREKEKRDYPLLIC